MAQRLAWPDIARGLSIFGVVILHVTLAVPNGAQTQLFYYNGLFGLLRMPVFFLVAGFFARKALGMTLGEVIRKRLWFLLVPYFIWAPVELWTKQQEMHYGMGNEMPSLFFYIWHILCGQNTYWFLYALAIYTFILCASKHLQRKGKIVLLICAIITPSIVEYYAIVNEQSSLLPIIANFSYLAVFLLGVYLRPIIERYAATALSISGIGIALASLALGIVLGWNDIVYGGFSQQIIQTILFIPSAIALSVLLSKVPVLSTCVQFVGRNTLVVYLGHQLALTLVFGFLFRYRGFAFSLEADNLVDSTYFWIVLCTVVAFGGGVVMHWLSKVPVIGWTIKPPALPVRNYPKTIPNA
ncbi:acyltransferase family protein [Corynebacterium sp. sy039]|uniref:acyltransferase family protein n=1 Tax=Corynebacterium sp. sy039 TaxID=2599641 RepID=UPI0011B5720C|nr:acyltransferase family protein [Corynebacterium sp. sy039]QDZ42936.1 acyltransferase family protein [Corynebacterium sp. sy039]